MPDLALPGYRLHYQTWGEGEPLLLLHSALGTIRQSWGAIPARLGRFGQVVALEMRGHGGSEVPEEGLRMEELVADVLRLADALGWERLRLAGFSMGGWVALAFALRHPERVSALNLHGARLRWKSGALDRFIEGLAPERLREHYPLWVESLQKEHGVHYGPRHWERLAGWTGQMAREIVAARTLSEELFGRLTMPVLVSVGDRDEILSLEEAVEDYRALPQGELAVIPATHHVLRTVSPELYAELVGDFFRRAASVGPRVRPMTF